MGFPYANQNPQIKQGSSLDSLYVVSQAVIAPFFAKIINVEAPLDYDIAANSEFTVNAEVSGVEDGKVWATLKPQGYMPPPSVGEFVTPEMTELITIEMFDDPAGLEFDSKYTGSTTALSMNSEYDLIIFAANSDGVVTYSDIHTVTVTGGTDNAKPTADFTWSPSSPKQEQEISFNNTSSDLDGSLVSFDWNFGDGSSSIEGSPAHTFMQAGTYTVTLTIWDDGGNNSTKTQEVIVSDGSQQIIPLSNGWNLSGAQTQIDVWISFADDTKFISLWKWDNGKWAVYLPGEDGGAAYAASKGFVVLTDIKPGEGFWVNSLVSESIVIDGTPETSSLSLTSGWNLDGLLSESGKNIMDLISGNEANIVSVWKWENGKWAVYLPGEEDGGAAYAASKGFVVLTDIKPGEGFWVNCTDKITLE